MEPATRLSGVRVADTIGAGDAFMSGLLYAAGQAGIASRFRTEDITMHEWSQILEIAQESAAFTVSRPGASPPSIAELCDGLAARRWTLAASGCCRSSPTVRATECGGAPRLG